jgi:chitinase
LDIAEIAATPALINLCTKEIEKSGKAEFKVFGKKHSLSMDKPTATKESRPPESSHSSAKTSSCGNSAKRADNGGFCDPQFNKRVTTAIVDDFDPVIHPILCNAYGQACYNYRSVANLGANFATLTCPYRRKANTGRPVSQVWTRQHKRALWDQKIMALPQGGCSPDEFPPAVMADVNDGYTDLTSTTQMAARNFQDRGQRIRYLPSVANKEAGGLFNVCPGLGPHRTEDHELISIEANGRRRVETTWTKVRAVFTRSRFTMNFAGLDNPNDDGIPDNVCAPTFNGNKHPGYALLNTDAWFGAHADELALVGAYANTPPNKRSWIEGRGLVVMGGNSSRAATPGELRRELGFDSCGDDECSRELMALREVTDAVREAVIPTRPVHVVAEATLVSEAIVAQGVLIGSLPGSDSSDPHFPLETGSVPSTRTEKEISEMVTT